MLRKTLTILFIFGLLLGVALFFDWPIVYLFCILLFVAASVWVIGIRTVLRKSWAIFPLVGLPLSVGMWAVSYLNVHYQSPFFEGLLHKGCWLFAGGFTLHHGGKEWELECSGFRDFETFPIPFGGADGGGFYFVLPLYIPTLLFGLVCAYRVHPLARRRRRKRKKLGLCVKCGYDLRGSKDTCPECRQEFGSTNIEKYGN